LADEEPIPAKTMEEKLKEAPEGGMSFTEHLEELRRRIIYAL
jgi:hypothetical protein